MSLRLPWDCGRGKGQHWPDWRWRYDWGMNRYYTTRFRSLNRCCSSVVFCRLARRQCCDLPQRRRNAEVTWPLTLTRRTLHSGWAGRSIMTSLSEERLTLLLLVSLDLALHSVFFLWPWVVVLHYLSLLLLVLVSYDDWRAVEQWGSQSFTVTNLKCNKQNTPIKVYDINFLRHRPLVLLLLV